MKPSDQQRYESLRGIYDRMGQGHVFAFWGELDDARRGELLDDLASIGADSLPDLARLARSGAAGQAVHADLAPARVLPAAGASMPAVERGEALLRGGRVAAFTVAGGQGTRLGFDGPKGAFAISPVKGKPLFQLFAEEIVAARRRFGADLHWYIMTSPSNDAATREFFASAGWFGLPAGGVTFFQQGMVPVFDREGRVLLDQKHRLAVSPDGHGGSLLAMRRSGVLDDMAGRGVEHISYFQVDNPLVRCLDPGFLGLHDLHVSEMSSKTLPKADDLERVGNFVEAGGRLEVIEYSDLPEGLARQRNADGTRRFDAANIAIHVLSRAFVERLTADAARFGLPWHRAEKKAARVDLSTGRRVEPDRADAVKLEAFIFDALPLARNAILVGASRAEEFSPVKNATGVDSVETARRDMSRRAARWMETAGFRIPRDGAGEPAGEFEISPLLATCAAELSASGVRPRAIRAGERVYLE